MPETQHVIAYSCHGMTVYISPLENAMLHWLIPVEGLFIFLSMLAAAMVVLAAAKVRYSGARNRSGCASWNFVRSASLGWPTSLTDETGNATMSANSAAWSATVPSARRGAR